MAPRVADISALFLAAIAFQKPYEHLSQDETKRTVLGYLAYLKDNTDLISNPGVRASVHCSVLFTDHSFPTFSWFFCPVLVFLVFLKIA